MTEIEKQIERLKGRLEVYEHEINEFSPNNCDPDEFIFLKDLRKTRIEDAKEVRKKILALEKMPHKNYF